MHLLSNVLNLMNTARKLINGHGMILSMARMKSLKKFGKAYRIGMKAKKLVTDYSVRMLWLMIRMSCVS